MIRKTKRTAPKEVKVKKDDNRVSAIRDAFKKMIECDQYTPKFPWEMQL